MLKQTFDGLKKIISAPLRKVNGLIKEINVQKRIRSGVKKDLRVVLSNGCMTEKGSIKGKFMILQ